MITNMRFALIYQSIFNTRLHAYVLKHCADLKSFEPSVVEEITHHLANSTGMAELDSAYLKLHLTQDRYLGDWLRMHYDAVHAKLAAGISARSVLAGAFAEMSMTEQFAHVKAHPSFIGQLAAHRLHPVKLGAQVLSLPMQAIRGVAKTGQAIWDALEYVRYDAVDDFSRFFQKADTNTLPAKVAQVFQDPLIAHQQCTEALGMLRAQTKGQVMGPHTARYYNNVRDVALYMTQGASK